MLHSTYIFFNFYTQGFSLSEDFSKMFYMFPKVGVLPNPKCKTSQRGACGGKKGKVCTSAPVLGRFMAGPNQRSVRVYTRRDFGGGEIYDLQPGS